MICKKCGKEIKDDVALCPYCGEKNIEDVFQNKPLYNTVPIWKIITLTVITLGLYPLVWTYNLWKQAKKRYNKKIDPLMRALFCVFTNFKLYPLINEYITNVPKESKENGNADEIKPFPATCFAATYIIFETIDHVLSKLFANNLLTTLVGIISLAVIISIIVTIQIKINKFNVLYNVPAKNDKWTLKTTGFIVIWLFVSAALIFGS